jgi:hypothetical protein
VDETKKLAVDVMISNRNASIQELLTSYVHMPNIPTAIASGVMQVTNAMGMLVGDI